jgi:hypothetical protein
LEKKATQSQEERAQAKEKVEVANAKEEERQEAEFTRRVAGEVAPYVDPPSIIPRRGRRRVSEREIASGGESDGWKRKSKRKQAEVTGRVTRRLLLPTTPI